MKLTCCWPAVRQDDRSGIRQLQKNTSLRQNCDAVGNKRQPAAWWRLLEDWRVVRKLCEDAPLRFWSMRCGGGGGGRHQTRRAGAFKTVWTMALPSMA
jgi:hypothetical protein